jgi:hypothetical protein
MMAEAISKRWVLIRLFIQGGFVVDLFIVWIPAVGNLHKGTVIFF